MSRDGVITRPIVNGGPANLAHGSEKSCPHPADLYSHKVYYGIYIERPIFPEDLARDFSRSAAFGRRKLDLEPVKGRLDMGRQLAAQNVVVEVEVHVGEDRPPGRKPLDPLERFGDREMARVRPVPQRVDDPDIEAFKRRNRFRRHTGKVAGIGEAAEPEAQRGDIAMLLQDADGQIQETHSVSAGLDYPSVGPEHALLHALGRVKYTTAGDAEALEAVRSLGETEGILPAIESAHALVGAADWAREHPGRTILVCLSGRGDKDMQTLLAHLVKEPA